MSATPFKNVLKYLMDYLPSCILLRLQRPEVLDDAADLFVGEHLLHAGMYSGGEGLFVSATGGSFPFRIMLATSGLM